MIHTVASKYNVVACTKFVSENNSETNLFCNLCDDEFYVSTWMGMVPKYVAEHYSGYFYEGVFR